MITHIHLENFKGFKQQQTIELKPLTLLFGPNSGGKSTVLQAIHFMREILERKNFNPDRTFRGGAAIDLGGFKNLVYLHDLSKPIILQFDLDLENTDLPNYVNWVEEEILFPKGEEDIVASFYRGIRTGYIKVKIEWNNDLQTAIVTSYETGFNGEMIAKIELAKILANEKQELKIEEINFGHALFEREDVEIEDKTIKFPIFFLSYLELLKGPIKEKMNLAIGLAQKTAIPEWGKELSLSINYSQDDPVDMEYRRMVENFFTRILVGPGELLLNELKDMRYIGPLRTVPARNYQPPNFLDDESWSDGLAAWDVIYRSKENFIHKVNTWLNERLRTEFSIKIKEMTSIGKTDPLMTSLLSQSILDEDMNVKQQLLNKSFKKELVFIDSRNGVECHAHDIGVGISQVLPVVVGTLDERAPLVLVEQPELHIHPAVQVNLGDLFISAIQKKNRMVIIETHSEHLILRLLKRIEQTTNDELPPEADPLKPDEISVLWFEPEAEGIKVAILPIDETGEFTRYWPRGFFEERGEELFG